MLRERVGASHKRPLSSTQLNALLDRVYNPEHWQQVSDPNPDLLPNKQSLNTRLHEYLKRAADTISTGMWPGPAMDRFRDIPPSLVLAIFEGDVAQVEPGGIGPLPLGHPVIRELVECVNNRALTPTLLSMVFGDEEFTGADEEHVVTAEDDEELEFEELLSDTNPKSHNKKLYDGGLVVGLLDYRKSCSFATVSTTTASTIPSQTNNNASLLSAMTAQGVAPEMHKIYLRPSYAALAPFMPAHREPEILLKLYPNLVTDPDPLAWQAMEWMLYDRDKVAVHCADLLECKPTDSPSGKPVNTRTTQVRIDPMPPLNKLKQLSAMDDMRSRKVAGQAEAFLGIDQRRNLARTRSSLPTTVMNNPNQRVWRTLRFERDSPDGTGPKQHYSLNILCLTPSGFEVVLRRGSVPDTAQGPHGFTQRFTLPTLSAVEQYIVHLKQLFGLEDGQRRLTVDVANPAVLSPLTTRPPSHRNSPI